MKKMLAQTWHDHLRQSAKYLYVFLIPTQTSSKCFFHIPKIDLRKKYNTVTTFWIVSCILCRFVWRSARACSQSSEFISITIHHRAPPHSDNAVIHLRTCALSCRIEVSSFRLNDSWFWRFFLSEVKLDELPSVNFNFSLIHIHATVDVRVSSALVS